MQHSSHLMSDKLNYELNIHQQMAYSNVINIQQSATYACISQSCYEIMSLCAHTSTHYEVAP